MATNWTPEQTDAIEVSGKAAVVSAAAGSGKTAVLVEKLLRLLSDSNDRVCADRIVVVTFTNDAAAQMKQRLSAKLAEAAEADPKNDWLINQQSLIPSAKISTIHSFCFDLIRQNAALLDADPSFRVLDSTEADSLEAQAAENVLARWFSEHNDEMTELCSLIRPDSRDESDFIGLISPLRKKLLALPFPEVYMDSICSLYESSEAQLRIINDSRSSEEEKKRAKDELLSDPFISSYLEDHQKLIDALSEHKSAASALLSELMRLQDTIHPNECAAGEEPRKDYAETADTKKRLSKLIPSLKTELDTVTNILESLKADKFNMFSSFDILLPYSPFKKNMFPVKYVVLGQKKPCMDDGDDRRADEAAVSMTAACHYRTKKLLAEKLDLFTFEALGEDYAKHSRMCRLIFGLMKEMLLEEKRLKTEKNALTFSDAEQLAVELLCFRDADGNITKTPLAKELSEYYSIVMIDEFQDSTAVQELIFRMLSKGGTADAPGSDFFAVGDVKQSIYRFRCSDPTLFLNNIKASSDYKKDGDEKRARIYLNRNFRSSHGVVEFVNAVFRAVMSEENGGAPYDENAELAEGAGIGDIYGPTELIELPCSTATEDDSDDPDADANDGDSGNENDDSVCPLDLIEAKCTAVRIRELISKEKIIENGEERSVKPSDICILMRNTKKAGLFISCLEELGIHAQGSAEESYLGSREISILINLLRSIDNVTLDIPLACVLMSPMFMFSAEDIAMIRSKRGSSVYNDILSVSLGDDSAFDELRPKCAEFIKTFGRLRDFAACHTVSELISFIYSKTDFMAVVSVYTDSLKKKANLRLLPILAEKFGENGSGSLTSFIRAVDVMIKNGKDFEAASAARSISETVDIKTIHKSKGLEYPFVFLCQSHVKFNLSDCGRQAVFAQLSGGSGYGLGFRTINAEKYSCTDSLPRMILSDMLRKSQRDEEMMLLYVALTRAKYKLFITRRNPAELLSKRGSKTAADKRNELAAMIKHENGVPDCTEAVSAANTMAEWLDIAISLFTEDKDDNSLLSLGECRAVITKGSTAAPKTKEVCAPEEAKPSEERAALLRKNLASDYDMTLSETASKLTVSEIAKKHEFKPKKYFDEGSVKKSVKKQPAGLSASDKGTAVHGFMQYGDLTRLAAMSPAERETAIPKEAARLCEKGYLTRIQAICADPEIIGKFLDSELCGRMIRSGNVMKEKKFLIKISDMCIDEEILDKSGLRVYNNTDGMLQGVADLIFEEEDRLILVDYKTDRNVTPDDLKERYGMQLYLYAKALSLILEKPVCEAYLYSFELGQAVMTDLAPEAVIKSFAP